MNIETVRKYFVKGVNAEIEELEKSIRKAKVHIELIDQRVTYNEVTMTRTELLDLIAEKRSRIEELRKSITEFDFTVYVEV